nr:serine hydrolase [uncultured Desulfobulbus sp.]
MKRLLCPLLFLSLLMTPIWASGKQLSVISQDPYISALVLDADNGKVLFEENADARVYPASVLKLMDLYVILNRIEQGMLKLDEMVPVTVEAAKTGGSQVYLDPKEQFTVDEMLFALMVQSANDAAVALATHIAGSKEGFVALMNQKAKELGMKNTVFHSVHGLPPGEGQEPDITTARDLAILCRELTKRPEALKYTSTRLKGFREDKFQMSNHNKLLSAYSGCDGLKTGYFTAAGFSIASTAKKGGVRIISLVMGSKDRKVRDKKAMELLSKGFTLVPPRPEQVAAVQAPVATPAPSQPVQASFASPPAEGEQAPPTADSGAPGDQQQTRPVSGWSIFFIGLGSGCVLVIAFFVVAGMLSRRRSTTIKSRYNIR